MKTTALIFLLSALSLTANAQTTEQQWQAKAVAKYPTLGAQGSDFNKRFVAAYNKRRASTPAFFTDPRWPLILADELAATPPQPKPTPPPTWIEHQWAALPADTHLPILIAAGAIGLVICVSSFNSLNRRLEWKRIRSDCDEYFALAEQGGIPTVPTNIMLKSDERAFYCAPASLYETRAVRHYQSGFAGFRIAKGIWIGGSQGRSVSNQEWAKLDSGMLTVTDKRIVFEGDGAARTIAVGKVVSVEERRDSVEVSVENRQKSMVFSAANPLILAAVIRISCDLHESLSQ